jgi:hypothetical protein
MLDVALAAVAEFLKTWPQLCRPESAEDQCRIAVDAALGPRANTGEPWVPGARGVWLVGHRCPVPRNPPLPNGREVEHMVLCIGDNALVDLTRCQYDPAAPVPLVYDSIATAGIHWSWFINGDSPDGPRHALHAPRKADRGGTTC